MLFGLREWCKMNMSLSVLFLIYLFIYFFLFQLPSILELYLGRSTSLAFHLILFVVLFWTVPFRVDIYYSKNKINPVKKQNNKKGKSK